MNITLESIKDPKTRTRVLQVGEKLVAAYEGDFMARSWIRQEAITTSDFPAIYQVLTNAAIGKAISEVEPPLWPKISKKVVLDSLRPAKEKTPRFDTSMLPESVGGYETIPGSLPAVPEGSPFSPIGFGIESGEISTRKLGARASFSWEAWLHDDLGILEAFPQELSRLAIRSSDLITFRQLIQAGAAGFNATLVTDATISGNPVLNYENLGKGLQVAKRLPAGQFQINTIQKWVLVVPPALEMTAKAILSATNLKQTIGGVEFDVPNQWAGSISEVLVNPYLGVLTSGWTNLNTHWMLVPAGGNGADRTTLSTTFLRGNETPELRIKDDRGQSIGGTSLSPYSGSFDLDMIETRVRYFTDAKLGNTVGYAVSNGSGS